MFIFYGVGEQVYKLHVDDDDSLVLRRGMWVDDHGLDHKFLRERRRMHRLILEHKSESGSSVRLDLDYVVWHLSSLRVAYF